MNKRSNIWACVIYPDSLPSNYLSIINNWHIPCLLSPLHSKDLNGDNTEKKAHYHLMLYFGKGANKSLDQVAAYTNQLNGTIPIIINNMNAMVRYFIHKDNPEKHQYDESELLTFSGFEYKEALESYTNDNLIYDKLESIIFDNCIYNYAILIKTLRDNNFITELNFIRRHSSHINYILNGYFQLVTNSKSALLDKNYRKKNKETL